MSILANNSGGENEEPYIMKSIHSPTVMRKKYNILKMIKSTYNRSDIIYRLHNYFKFLVVRHPVDRLISAYNDKLVIDPPTYLGMAQQIIRTYRPGADEETIMAGKNVTFREFLLYYLHQFKSLKISNKHFQVVQRLCSPCQVNYDYVAKLETQSTDAKYIISEKLAGRGADSIFNMHSHREGASVYKDLPEINDLMTEELDDLQDIYSWDMNMFGYSIDYYNGTLRAMCGVGDGGCC